MLQSMTYKILEQHTVDSGWSKGDNVVVRVDKTYYHDATGGMVTKIMAAAGNTTVSSPEDHFVVFDHAVPSSSIQYTAVQRDLRKFLVSNAHHRRHFYDVGVGIGHQVLAESRLIKPGNLVVGADSHTCTAGALNTLAYGMGATDMAAALVTKHTWLEVPGVIHVALTGTLPPYCSGKDVALSVIRDLGAAGGANHVIEYAGLGVESLTIDARLSICNMAVECGATAGIMPFDHLLRSHYQGLSVMGVNADPGAHYDKELVYDLSALEPVVAAPHSPDNVHRVSQLEPVPVDQAFIGSCTNGRLSDLRIAAKILKNKKVSSGTRLIIIPSSRTIQLQAMREGLFDIFVESGAIINHSNCGPCLGMHEGLLAPGEVCISAANRNYRGRMGSPDAAIYLGSPATVAASAIAGRIVDPREVLL